MNTTDPGPGHVLTAAMVLTDVRRRVLLVRRLGRDQSWTLPGGIVGPEDSPGEAAQRQVARQLGIRVEPVTLLTVHCIRRHGQPGQLAFTFLGVQLAARHLTAITPRRRLISAWCLEEHGRACALLPEHIADRIPGPIRPGVPSTAYLETIPRRPGVSSRDSAPGRTGPARPQTHHPARPLPDRHPAPAPNAPATIRSYCEGKSNDQ
ncbi:NUDIX domain-containing protein [Streptomyces synnematoformans]|uniref:Nudix hydrolase domain-containing protein n=1 Tax=Streptomyces synnematoformans TaxID=415721 RepID=A0ABP5K700_9ACTN